MIKRIFAIKKNILQNFINIYFMAVDKGNQKELDLQS